MTWWLVKYPGTHSFVLTDDEFWAFAERVKYDGVKYAAEPMPSGATQPEGDA